MLNKPISFLKTLHDMFGSRSTFALATILLAVILFTSCSSKKAEIPEGIIPKEKMIAIMIDVQEAESKIQANDLSKNDSTRAIAYGYYNFIFKKHQTNSSAFKNSINYYVSHLDLFNKMYDEVITGLSKKQAESVAKK